MLPDEQRDLRIAAIAASLVVCAGWRFAGEGDGGPLELVPVLGAALWFGRRWALIVTGVAFALTAVSEQIHGAWDLSMTAVEIALLALTAYVVGGLGDRQRAGEAELERIRPLQDVLAPRKPPRLPLIDVASRYIPAQAGVSGDFYQVAAGRNGAAIVVVGDVVGKGMDAARRSTFARAIVAACAPYAKDPATIVRTVNTELVHQYGVSAHFITMLCVVVHANATVSWASAGHPPPVSLADGEPIGALRTGHPLGIAPEIVDLEVAHAPLPAAGILLYTDGLTDARPPGRRFQPFGEARVSAVLREVDAPTPEEAVQRLAHAAQRFSGGPLPDDLCLVALRSRFEAAWYTGRDEPVGAEAAGPPPPEPARGAEAVG
ncbi:MAG: PP2C family protein-serine/threonine phosphatase [Solirubrobacteraceae bacterium]